MFEFHTTDDLSDGEICLRLHRITEANPELGYVPAYHFAIHRCSDNFEVGHCDLRIGYNENVYYGGHIGYIEGTVPFRFA